jgi:nitroimidazol reductase NimA-like FMN-containing flavoprotein (pyridoxamine 5'-phosphate oxidase superfamily)
MAGRGESTGHGFMALDESACWDRLPQARVGRLAWTDPDGRIMVVPVNFGVDGHCVVIRTGNTSLLDAARAGKRCGFQAEDLEPGLRSGWTVLVDGLLTVADDEATAERLGRLADPWLRELRPIVLVLTATQITGRALHPAGGVHIVQADEWS